MADRTSVATQKTTIELGSVNGAMAYLAHEEWWPAFRARRRSRAQLVDDVLWVGHFCSWLQAQRIEIERCTYSDLAAYLATIDSFRPGPRSACQRTVTALMDFLAATNAH
jgi:hypothetical protein